MKFKDIILGLIPYTVLIAVCYGVYRAVSFLIFFAAK